MPPTTRAKIVDFIQHMVDHWDILNDPFMTEIFKLHQSNWNAADSTLEVTIDINSSTIKQGDTPYTNLSKTDAVKYVLYKYLYTRLIPRTAETYAYHLRQHGQRMTAFVPVVLDVAIAW